MPVTAQDFRQRGRRLVCASGDTRFFLVPRNQIGYATHLQVDTSDLSGVAGAISVQIRDTFQPISGSSGTVIRKELAVRGGDVIAEDLGGGYPLMGGIDVRVDTSGPIISLAAVFR